MIKDEKFLTAKEAREIQLDDILYFKPNKFSKRLKKGKVIRFDYRDNDNDDFYFELEMTIVEYLGIENGNTNWGNEYTKIPYTDCQLP